MKKTSHLAIYSVSEWQKEYIKERLPEAEFPEELRGDYEIISVFVSDKIDLTKFPNLKFIAARSTGFDHIDLKECDKRNIIVANVPDYGRNTVAEFAFALLLALSRKVFESYEVVQTTGKFIRDGLTGFDLKGKTLGVIGTGSIGSRVIEIGRGLGMEILGCDPNKNLNIKYLELESLLAQSDVITIHVPYNEKTHHLLNKKNIKRIKKGAYLINTSRGGIIEQKYLVKALEKEQLAGAGLDVLEDEENLLKNKYSKKLISLPQVIVTPHNAFNTKEALIRILDTTVENIKGFKNGKIINRVNS